MQRYNIFGKRPKEGMTYIIMKWQHFFQTTR